VVSKVRQASRILEEKPPVLGIVGASLRARQSDQWLKGQLLGINLPEIDRWADHGQTLKAAHGISRRLHRGAGRVCALADARSRSQGRNQITIGGQFSARAGPSSSGPDTAYPGPEAPRCRVGALMLRAPPPLCCAPTRQQVSLDATAHSHPHPMTAKALDLSRRLAHTVTLTGGPRSHLVTPMDEAILIRDSSNRFGKPGRYGIARPR
jgi:hypothetical protein